VRILRISLLAGILSLSSASAHAAHTQAQLILANDSARPGETVLAGVHLKMEPAWHTYWKNPGEAGMATSIQWQLPPGVTAGEIQWPLPEKLPPADVTTYGYQNEVVLLVPLKLAADLKPGPLDLKAKVSWLECKEQCIPAGADVEATLAVGPEDKASASAATIQSWQAKVPKESDALSVSYSWEKLISDDSRPMLIELSKVPGGATSQSADFYPDPSEQISIQGSVEKVTNSTAKIAFSKIARKFSGDWPKEFSGVIVIGDGDARQGYQTKFSLAAGPAASAAFAPFSLPALLGALGSAFLGGLILNIMPCVLPVIALKVFSFVKQSGQNTQRARQLGVVYALGVVFSFLILAGFLIAAQKAGHVTSWGSQMQNRNFVLGMTIVVTLIALNLFGLFEVTLGSGAMSAADSLSGKSGFSGAFFNGVLATSLAIPCTAPILASAVAFAFAHPPAIIVLIFCFIGLGLAAPYVILTWNPKLLKFMPKPGAWMQRFKVALGFPMLATAVWMYKISMNHLSKSQSLWFGIFLVTLGAAAWVWGEFVQRGTSRRILAAAVSFALIAGVGAYAATRHEGLVWARWSSDEVRKAQSDGHPVLVDFTADWCLTCQLNLHHSIDIPEVRRKLAEVHAKTLIADYTVQDETIGRELHRFGRDAVPLVVVFPKDPTAEPIVLPPLLTPSIVQTALDQAAK
jgi:thiol:disulfide interchange protein